MAEMKSQLDSLSTKLQEWIISNSVVDQCGPYENTQAAKVIIKAILLALHKLMVSPYCLRKHLIYLTEHGEIELVLY